MRAFLVLLLAILLSAGITHGRPDPDVFLTIQGPLPGEPAGDRPRSTVAARADTVWFGDYEVIDGTYYARSSPSMEDVLWTFDRGNGPFGDPDRLENGAGWRATHPYFVSEIYFRVIDGSLDLGDGVAPPILSGMQSLWVGIDQPQADTLCYECGAGYGNYWWGQRAVSEPLAYNGEGDVTLTFLYFCDSEDCYDGTQVYLRRADDSELLLNPYPAGECSNNTAWLGGTFTGLIGSPGDPAAYTRAITAAEIGGAQEIRIIFEFISDGGWSDEDCLYPTTHGPFAADDVAITGGGIDVTYDFEDGLQGWTPMVEHGDWLFADVTDVGCYTILDSCACDLEANILEVHDRLCDEGYHADGQEVRLESPICDLGSFGPSDFFLEFDAYFENYPGATDFRVCWSYYPWICPVTGEAVWSPPSGCSTWDYYYGPRCGRFRRSSTGGGVPPAAEKVIAYLEITCRDWFGFGCFLPPPLIDNLVIGVVPAVPGPIVSLETGASLQDTGSYPSSLFDVRAPGPANVTRNLNLDDPQAPVILGDSLVVIGPETLGDPNARWDAKLWWRVAKKGPMQSDVQGGAPTRYGLWKSRVADGKEIDRPHRPEFTWGWMDSVQMGVAPLRYKFKSEFREDDDDFVGEGNPDNEMLWDDIFVPGTRIEYFVTASYRITPDELVYLPDTTGGFYFEFEVLPGVRLAQVPGCGGPGFDQCLFLPATLYIDAYNRGSQLFFENALATILNGQPLCERDEGCPVPPDRNWDRYDYTSSDGNFGAPFARAWVPGSNNGMTLNQILGYRTILLNTGTLRAGAMHEEDFTLFRDWLTNSGCDANANRQMFLANGDAIGEILEALPMEGEPFLNEVLGASLLCDAFNGHSDDPDCEPLSESYCVRLLPSEIGPFGTGLDVDAFGNTCPNDYRMNVFGPAGSGIGNRIYAAEDGLKEAEFAEVVNQDLGAANYRTVVAAPSWDHLTCRVPGGEGMDLCPRDLPPVVAGMASEIGAAMRWGFDAADDDAIPKLASAEALGTCQGTWAFPVGVDEMPGSRLVTRLYQNEPNPFNPGTAIRFSLAQMGGVKLVIYDVNGRHVRTLFHGRREAGLHTVIWDGTNDDGRPVGSGVYWSQMTAGSYVSNKKMIVLK